MISCAPRLDEFLVNHGSEFNKTLWEASLLRGDAHIITPFQSDYFHRVKFDYVLCFSSLSPSVLNHVIKCLHYLHFNVYFVNLFHT